MDIEALCLEALELGVRLAKGKGVTVRLGAAAPAVAHGDAGALRRALLNLVDNAVKYTPAGGSIVISLDRTHGGSALVVEDTGIGIDPADTERIFEPFVRLDAGARPRGRRQRARPGHRPLDRRWPTAAPSRFESRAGGGSRFTIRLPAA